MNKLLLTGLQCILFICAWFIIISYFQNEIVNTISSLTLFPNIFKDTFTNQPILHNINDNVIKNVSKTIDELGQRFDNYDYSTLNNGSLQLINETLQTVIDKNNSDSRLLTFNPCLQPVIQSEINIKEFTDFGNFLIDELNNSSTYKCYTFIDVKPDYKIKTDSQVKMQFHIYALYKHPSYDDEIILQFLVVLISEQFYSEWGKMEEPTLEQLPFDIVPASGKTYIETLMLKKND